MEKVLLDDDRENHVEGDMFDGDHENRQSVASKNAGFSIVAHDVN